ncbi:uncharacterized protein EV420DRAFT_1650066 [Desarmillaria tabescens]|uniref:Uncharacterized protein n=1 Tax=Armillaria tabescens TaxID=1929756 RepID=A0AA39MPI1_ARMTA|nr:uncharacterized protein EV420DRAFT_1650066 [Desarmillaria tabescens]KAK0441468.1 hypothetical protein EV420DRAFT_1650066 [Desarmillaria tabescens]
MDAFPSGSRIFFYGSKGQLVRGVVESTSRTSDGTEMVLIKCDNGKTITLPLICKCLLRLVAGSDDKETNWGHVV